jgi:predicted ATPase with chaperone activity
MNFKELIDVENVKRAVEFSEIGEYSTLILGNTNTGKTSILKCIKSLFPKNLFISTFINGKKVRFIGDKILLLDNLHKFTLEEVKFIFKNYKFNRFYITSQLCKCGNENSNGRCLDIECEKFQGELNKKLDFIFSKSDIIIELQPLHSDLFYKTYKYYSKGSDKMYDDIFFAGRLLFSKIENFAWSRDTDKIYSCFKTKLNPLDKDLNFVTNLAEIVCALEEKTIVDVDHMSEAIQYYINKLNILEEWS